MTLLVSGAIDGVRLRHRRRRRQQCEPMAARIVDAVLGFYVDSMRAMPLLVVLVWTKLGACRCSSACPSVR